MNSGKAAYIVGFVIWIFSGFKLTFREAIGYDHKESLYFKYHPYKVTEHLSSGKFKFGKSRTISGEYNNAAKKEVHLDKRNQQGYDFKDVAEMEAYSKDFFAREGNNIIELKQNG